ncbi:MAG TPA: DUF3488 and transglutaminase-like domain-containing protein [Terriglobia bacterium]
MSMVTSGGTSSHPGRGSAGLERYFQISLFCTLATAFFTLASTGRLDRPSVALFSIVLLSRILVLASGRNWRFSPGAVTALAVCYVFFYPLDLAYLASGQSLVDRMLVATVHLVLFATAVKVLSASTDRDHAYLAVLSLVMMLAAAILTVGAVYLAGFGLYILFAISTLLSYEVRRPFRRVAVPEPGEGTNRSAEKHGSKPVEAALGKTALCLALALIPVAAFLFFLIPRYRSGYWSRLALQPQRITGFTETVDLGDISKILRSNQVVMRITPKGDPGPLEGEKLRGVALANFDGQRWSNGVRGGHLILPASPQQFRPPDFAGLAARPATAVRYRVLLEPVSTEVLFVAGRARQVIAPVRFLLVDRTGSLLDPDRVPGPFAYEVVSDLGLPSARELREDSAGANERVTAEYLELPRLDARIAGLARQITAGSGNDFDRAVSVQDYLQGHYAYTLDLPPVEPTDPVSSFLFQTKRGNCEFFAAAMAVMLRSLRIPARLVNGFEMGTYNPVGKDFVIRGRDAHSWVEVYFPGHGWLPFDPTPAGSETDAGVFRNYLDAAELFWDEWVVNYDFGRQVQLAVAVQTTSRGFDRRFRELRWHFERLGVGRLARLQDWLGDHRLQALAAIIVLLALATLAVRHPAWIAELRAALAWRLAASYGTPSPHAASLAYQRFLRALARSGFEKAPTETPLEFADKLQGAAFRQQVTAFTELYQAMRFGHQAIPIAELETSLRTAVGAPGLLHSRPDREP